MTYWVLVIANWGKNTWRRKKRRNNPANLDLIIVFVARGLRRRKRERTKDKILILLDLRKENFYNIYEFIFFDWDNKVYLINFSVNIFVQLGICNDIDIAYIAMWFYYLMIFCCSSCFCCFKPRAIMLIWTFIISKIKKDCSKVDGEYIFRLNYSTINIT